MITKIDDNHFTITTTYKWLAEAIINKNLIYIEANKNSKAKFLFPIWIDIDKVKEIQQVIKQNKPIDNTYIFRTNITSNEIVQYNNIDDLVNNYMGFRLYIIDGKHRLNAIIKAFDAGDNLDKEAILILNAG